MITRRETEITMETHFDSSDIYGSLGALANVLFGGPRTTEVRVYPEQDEVLIIASYGSLTLREGEINSNPICNELRLAYVCG